MPKNQTYISDLNLRISKLMNERRYEVIALIALGVCSLTLSFWLTATRTGDGAYYFSMLISLAENASPAITQIVRDQVSERVGFQLRGLELQSSDGLMYPIHFFAYSAASIPAYKILQLLHIDTLKSFQVTNAIILTLSIFYVLFSGLSARSRWVITVGFLLSTGFYYFQWTHPELFTASALIVSSIALLERKYTTSVLFAAIGSLQNPSVIFIIPFIAAMQLFDLRYRSSMPFFHRKALFEIGRSFIVSLLALVPYAWSYLKFNAFNPIAKAGYVDYSNINLDRFLSFMFDLNQGLIVGLPMLLYAVPVVLVMRMLAMSKEKSLPFRREDILLICFIFVVAPTLVQLNWNSGQNIFLRYGSWAGMLVLVWAAVSLGEQKRSLLAIGIAPALLIQIFMFSYLVIIHPTNYVSFKPWVASLWQYFPHSYDPLPEIFYERTHHKESFTSPTVFRDSGSNTILRVLTKRQNYEGIENEVCGSEARLNPIDNRPDSAPQIRATERGFNYMTGRFICISPLLPGQNFSHKESGRFSKGWSATEPTHRWSEGKESLITFAVTDREAFAGTLKLHCGSLGKQQVTIMLNGTEIYSEMLATSDKMIDIPFDRSLLKNGANTLAFKLPNARRPGNGDMRVLALAFKSIQID